MTTTKIAGKDQDFEQGFFQLAYDKLQGKLYNLLPFMVGFELVKKNDDDTKAIGVFGFKSGNGQIIYVPAFFINGKIKDMELMYSKNNNQFYPLNEDFALLFLKEDVTGMGSPAHEKKEDIRKSVSTGNLRDVIYPPRTGRIAYASCKSDKEFNRQIQKEAYDLFTQQVDDKPGVSVLEFVKNSGLNTKAAFWSLMQKEAMFSDSLRHFYEDDEIASSLLVEKKAEEKPEAKLEILKFEDNKDFSKQPEEVKKNLTNKGYSIVDNRGPDEKTRIGLFKYTEKFTNPSASGFYPYITQYGTLRYGLVLMKPESLRTGFSFNKTILLDLESSTPGQAYIIDNNQLFVKDQFEVKDVSEAFDLLQEPAEASPGYDYYILINRNLAITQPFKIVENFKDSSGIRRIKVEPGYLYDWDGCCDTAGSGLCGSSSTKTDKSTLLVFTKHIGDKIEHRSQTMYIPKGYKLLKIETNHEFNDPDRYSSDMTKREAAKAKQTASKQRFNEGKPGALCHLTAALTEKNIFPMTLHSNGSEYFLNIFGAKKKYKDSLEAKIAMVMDLGLDEKSAEDLVESVNINTNTKLEGVIKIAYLGDFTLPVQDEPASADDFGNPMYYGIPYVDSVDTTDGYKGDPTRIGLGVKPDFEYSERNVTDAATLAQSGQKEIFDTQAISTLAKYTDPSTKIINYVPDFVTTLDKLGRMLFLTYWETDKFQEMYGKDELPELVELVKSVFNNLGDLIIFMKRKVPDLSINANEQSKDQI